MEQLCCSRMTLACSCLEPWAALPASTFGCSLSKPLFYTVRTLLSSLSLLHAYPSVRAALVCLLSNTCSFVHQVFRSAVCRSPCSVLPGQRYTYIHASLKSSAQRTSASAQSEPKSRASIPHCALSHMRLQEIHALYIVYMKELSAFLCAHLVEKSTSVLSMQ